jgi:hypothetical protein
MYELVALDIARQRQDELERLAERARLIREARPKNKRTQDAQGR